MLRVKSDCLNTISFKSDCLNMTHWLLVVRGAPIVMIRDFKSSFSKRQYPNPHD